MVAASFIRTPEDVHEIRAVLGEKGKKIKIISKIESTEGLENFDQVLSASGIFNFACSFSFNLYC